jgi:hypothetical protein
MANKLFPKLSENTRSGRSAAEVNMRPCVHMLGNVTKYTCYPRALAFGIHIVVTLVLHWYYDVPIISARALVFLYSCCNAACSS